MLIRRSEDTFGADDADWAIYRKIVSIYGAFGRLSFGADCVFTESRGGVVGRRRGSHHSAESRTEAVIS